MIVRSSFSLPLAVLIAAVAIAAQGPPPTPAATGLTTARTWTDADYDKIMKEVGATVGLLRKSIDGQNAELAKQQADKLELLFEEADDFWNARNVRDAADWADDAAEHADHIEDAADDKDFTKAAEHMKLLQGTCTTCHGKYRDKAPDGSFRIKP
jgi:cytochrome c556